MRRKDRQLGTPEAVELLIRGEYGVLSTVDADGQPYGMPLSYLWRDNTIYFHCALSGHKLDNLAANPRVSFCVVGRTRVLPEQFATEYESAVAFGRAAEVFGEERHAALLGLLEKYAADYPAEGKAYLTRMDAATRVIGITVEGVTGKARH